MIRTRSPGGWRFLLAGFALLAGSTQALAQAQAGAIRGTVTDRATGMPISAARVQVVGRENAAANTDDRGTYLIRNAPTGQHTLRITRLGYRPESRQTNITGTDTVTVDFGLGQSAVELQQVVVTGTGGAVEKRKIGASLGTVDVAAQQELMPSTSFSQVLAAKVSGVRSTMTGGGVGSGQDLRIRGMASFSLNQRPVIYIDGVRIDSKGTEWAMGNIACCAFTGGASTDRLSDLNPNDIERVEILKGAAAATLYGSEATNGVIQIFTKKGRGERTQWNLGVGSGFNRLRENLPTKTFPRFTGPDGFRARDANDLIKNGMYNSFDISGQGSTTRSTYYVSGLVSKEEGSIQPNDQTKGNLRLNITFVPTGAWTIETRSSYARNLANELQAGNNWTALLGNAINGNPRTATETRPHGEAWVPVSDIERMQTTSDADRWTGGVTLSYALRSNFTHRLIMGMDAVNEQKSRFFPFAGLYGPAGVTDGQRNLGVRNYRTTTVDYLGTLDFKLPGSIESNFSYGAQGFWETQRLNMAVGDKFPGPGVSTVSSAALTNGAEEFQETTNLGILAQNRFAWKDRLFATVGVRMDGNSAFGEDFGFQTYPKFDMSYDLSQHGFLPPVFSALRVRAAVGQAGKMPGAFDSFQSYAAAPVFEDVSGIVPLNPGNKDLKPETTTEQEFGFEAGLWDDRLGLEASMYFAKTEDAIVNKANPPSGGFSEAQRVNIGALENKGWEASINYLVFSRPRMEWSTSVKLDGNKNKVTDLGGVVLSGNAIRLGYPVQSNWDRVADGFEILTGGTCPAYGCPTTSRTDSAVYIGPPLPTFNGAMTNTFRFGAFQIYGTVSMERGAILNNGDRAYRIRQGGSDEYLQHLGPNGERTFKADSVFQYASFLNYFDKRDNVRIREISATYQIPDRFSGLFKVGRSSITMSAFNLMWWDDCNCVDPNMAYDGASAFGQNSGFLAQPSARQYRVQVRTRF